MDEDSEYEDGFVAALAFLDDAIGSNRSDVRAALTKYAMYSEKKDQSEAQVNALIELGDSLTASRQELRSRAFFYREQWNKEEG